MVLHRVLVDREMGGDSLVGSRLGDFSQNLGLALCEVASIPAHNEAARYVTRNPYPPPPATARIAGIKSSHVELLSR